MTAFMSAVLDGNRIEILSDGASYNLDGYVTGLGTKVHAIPNFLAAQMTRGEVEMGRVLQKIVCDLFALAKSFDHAIELLHGAMTGENRESWEAPVQLVIWGISETKGPMTYWFATKDVFKGDGRWKLMSTPRDFYQGEAVEWPAPYLASGTLADKAVFLMQDLRKQPHLDLASGERYEGSDHPIVGGHIDLTTISADGVSQRRLHTWPDRVGERMCRDPAMMDIGSRIAFDAGKEVVFKAMAAADAPRLSRQQRRALAKKQAA